MRILSVTAQKPMFTGSGVYMTELMRAMGKLGAEQAVVAGIAAGEEMQLPDGVQAFPVYFESEALPFPVCGMSDEMPYRSTRYSDLTEEQKKLFLDAFYEAMHRAVSEFRPDLILCHHLYLLTAHVRKWFPEHRICGFCHGSDLRQFMKNEKWRDEISGGIRGLDRIFALHAPQAEKIRELHLAGSDRKAEVIGSGYSDRWFFPRKTLVFTGKITEKKGIYSLLAALRQLPYSPRAFRLILVGDYGSPRDEQEVGALLDGLPYEVSLPGRLGHAELSELFRASDGFILPSFYEGMPLVVIEACACGLPVICTDLPGIREFADENAPGHGIRFVEPPRFTGTDEPVPEDLPAFESRLACAIREMFGPESGFGPDLSALTWEHLAARVMAD